ncbi:AraC family transcriptional regulator [Lysobacter sp. 2RAB21]
MSRPRASNPARKAGEPLTMADLAELALAAGYYDQAHFNHDFRRATGRAPTAFFDAAVSR